MKKKLVIILAVVIGLIALRYAISFIMQLNMAKSMKASAVPPVTVSEIQTDSVPVKIPSPARIVSIYRVDVLARINGYLTKSYFKEGDYVKKGQIVEAGQQIGEIGTTGDSTGCHLHIEIYNYVNGYKQRYDPMNDLAMLADMNDPYAGSAEYSSETVCLEALHQKNVSSLYGEDNGLYSYNSKGLY